MSHRKSVEESLVLEGPPAAWLERSRQVMEAQGYRKVTLSQSRGQLSGDLRWRVGTIFFGSLTVLVEPEGAAGTRMTLQAAANVDNIFAALGNPGQRIIERFEAGLRPGAS